MRAAPRGAGGMQREDGVRRAVLGAWLCAVALMSGCAKAAPISYVDLLARPRPAPTKRIAYGPGPMQFGELWSPATPGRHPVVIMLHGGCWLASLPGTELMAYVSEDLRRRGIAVWNIDYRRLGDRGGGYPGTFEDVGQAVDYLRRIAKTENLDLGHVVLVGHSAGGHLAIWAAARHRLPPRSPLFAAHPLPVAGVVSLAGMADLAAYRADGPAACGGPDTIDQLTGASTRRGQSPYADTSPAALAPIGTPQAVVSGSLDPIVPPRFGHAYAARARAAGDTVQELEIAGAGHMELVDPTSEAWRRIEPMIEAMLKRAA
jgi:acetyl esterase/lipase